MLVSETIKREVLGAISSLAASEAPRLRLSGIGLCPRQQIFSIQTGQSPDLTAMEGILATGKLFEDLIQTAFPTAISQREVELEGIKGHVDFLLPDQQTVLEVKTIGITGLSLTPIDHHVWQVQAYLAALKEETDLVWKGFIIYLPREDIKHFVVHEVVYDPNMDKEIRRKLKEIKEHLANNTVPSIPEHYRPDKFPCKWWSVSARRQMVCPFYSQCWTEQPQQASTEVDTLEEAAKTLATIREQKKALEQEEQTCRAILLNAFEQGVLREGTNKLKSVAVIVKTRPDRIQLDPKLATVISQKYPDFDLSPFVKQVKGGVEIQVKTTEGGDNND